MARPRETSWKLTTICSLALAIKSGEYAGRSAPKNEPDGRFDVIQEVSMSLQVRSLALGGAMLCFAFGAGQAFAADATQVADALVAAMQASNNTKVVYQSASAAGDDVAITGFTATNENGGTVTIPTLTITGAAPRDKGGFTAASMTFDNGKVVDQNTNISWQTGSLTDATVPSADEIKAKVHLRPFSRIDIAGLTVEGGELPAPFTIASVGAAVDTDADGTPRDFDLTVAGIKIPPEVFEADPQQKAILDQLGYSGFLINLNVAGGYETEGDILTLRSFTIDVADAGKLAISGKFNGVSLRKMFEGDNPGDIGSNGSIEQLTVRFDNAGIVERVLDMQAKMMGMQRQDVVAQTAGALPFMLNFLGNPPFQDKVAKAGTSFLTNPHSITVSATPSAPVSFNQIAAAAGQSPQSLPDLLAVDVVANN